MASSSQQALLVPASSTDENKSNEEIALNEISFNFTSFLQTFMRDSNYDFQETEVFSSSFLTFMHNALFYLAQDLLSLQSNLSKKVNEEEQTCIDEIYRHNPLPEIGDKIDKASKLMKKELPQKIKQCMIDAKFEQSEIEETHDLYVSMVSSVLISETGKFLRFKERFRYTTATGDSSNNNDIMPSSQNNLSVVPSSRQQQLCAISNEQEIQKRDNNDATPSPHIEEAPLNLNPTSLQLIATSRKHNVYHLISENVMMKVLNPYTSTAKDIKILDNELEFGKTFYHPSIRRSLERTVFQNTQALILEWAHGVPLNQIESLDVKKFLKLAREITSPLLAIHTNHLMHMNLSCDHIIYNGQNDSAKIISCGSCTTFGNNRNYISKQDIHQKDLRFISPEQTGRVNRHTDYRSDFYSLGVVFYRLLTGKYPFESENKLNLLHLHIFQDPVPACTINPNIPVILSDMISILLAKNAEDRYRSTKGIVHDLDLMISEYDIDNNLSSIVLVQHDVSETLLVPQKLYGRSDDYNALLSSFDRISTTFELVMVSGDSGTGKSALVSELYKVVAQKDGVLISGKYHFSKSEPYSALLTAFNNFCDDLLLKEESTIINFRRQISNAVGQEGGYLASVITNLDLIIGQQPSISDAIGQGSKTAKNRFHYVFVKLIKAICSVGFPIVLVLEDLQWMDLESLSLLSALVTDKTIKNLLFVGTHRESEVNASDPVNVLINVLKNSKNTLTQIKLGNLNHDTLNELIADALCIPSHATYALTALVSEKTKGNAFFANQMIRTFSEQGLIFFCNEKCQWTWDAAIFGENDISGNVLGLLRLKIQALDENTQQALKVASCLGSSFSLQTLKLIVNRANSIECALSTGLITKQNGSDRVYRFVHDQIQEAAFSLLPADPRQIFLYIGQKLWAVYSKNELIENIFVVIHLLNYAKDLITDQEQRSKVAELFLLAGNRAITSTAFTQACEYLEAGINMLGENCWEFKYDLSLKLHDAAAKMCYCISNYTSLDIYIKAISKNAASALHTVQTYALQIRFYNDNRKFQDAFDTAVCILNKIGENINYTQSEAEIDSLIDKTKLLLNGKSYEEITEMEEMQDESKLAIMMILSESLSTLHFFNPQLYCLVSLRMVHLTLQCGISKFSPLGFIALGSALCGRNTKDRFPYELGKLSIKILDKIYVKEFVPWVYGPFYGLIAPFYESIHGLVKSYSDLFKISVEVGSNLGSIVVASTYVAYAFLSGKHLEKLIDDFSELGDIVSINHLPYLATHQTILNLLEPNTENPALLSGHIFDYKSCHDGTIDNSYNSRCLVLSCMVAYLFNDYASSLKFVQDLRPIKKFLYNLYHYPVILFFEGLVSLAVARTEEKWITVAEKNIVTLKNFSENAPENFLNKVLLLEAELAVVRDDQSKAKICFKEAIYLAKKHGFIHEEGMACEREGLFFLDKNLSDEAHCSLWNAYNCYEKWGAKRLLKKLTKNHPIVFERLKEPVFKVNDSIHLQLNNESECSVSLLTETSFASNTSKRKRVTFKM